uniref:beta-L-arabinofuranosidase domain-containing protein n=1 Tax=Prevotella sp. TaxID=59823 RepID=UPI004026FDF4
MNKKSIAIVAGLLVASSFNVLSSGGKALAVGNGGSMKCQPFRMNQVRLLPSRFQENMKRDSAWMMSIPVNSLLQSFRNTSGAFSSREGGYMTVKKLGGWESLDCDLRGHITGHLLSAYATLYAQTGSQAVKMKADSIVNGLAEVQQAYGRGGYLSAFAEGLVDRNIQGKSVWAPFYTLHKIVQGLIDQYQMTGNVKALEMAKGMGDWAYNKLKPLSEETRKKMIRNEFGGFNEAMYELYALTKDERYLWVARYFYHNEKIDPLKAGNPDLGTNHANTFIPKLLGEARNYELFGAKDSRKAAELLFWTLVNDHAFVTGELSDKEHLFKPTEQSKHLTGYDGENCCTFNLLKLADHLFSWNPSSKIADYYERALYNHILGQQDPESSMVCYFTPLQTGAYRLYSTRDSSFWCCVGSGFESHVKYASSIYFHSDKDLYVNLFIPSKVDWEGTTFTQQTSFPQSSTTTFTVDGNSKQFALRLRYPSWATKMDVKVNGKKVKAVKGTDGYVAISRLWKAGDKIEVQLGMQLREEATKDDASKVALLYGPIVMAGKLDKVERPFSDPTQYNDYYTFDFKIPASTVEKAKYEGLKSIKNFKMKNGVELVPFYDAHHCRYAVYWQK